MISMAISGTADYVDSYYARTLSEPGSRPALDGALDTETCVIGGGLAGLATALDLAERGRSVALLESHRVGWGASGRNGGFMSPGFGAGVPALVDKVGLQQAREMYALSRHGHALVRERIQTYGIDCGPVEAGGLRCAMAGRDEGLEAHCAYMAKEFDTKFDYWPAARVRESLATSRYSDAFFNPHTYRLHPLNLVRGMARALEAKGGRIFEQSRVTGIDLRPARREVRTANGLIRADHVVLACGGYIGWLFWPVSAATVPVATFVMVTEPLGDRLKNSIRVPYAVSDIQTPTNYYWPLADGRLMWGGRVLATRGRPPRPRPQTRYGVVLSRSCRRPRRGRLGRSHGISPASPPGHRTTCRWRLVRHWIRRARPGIDHNGRAADSRGNHGGRRPLADVYAVRLAVRRRHVRSWSRTIRVLARCGTGVASSNRVIKSGCQGDKPSTHTPTNRKR
jgi:gamma-glutamylputrescine oxidase